MSSTDAVAAAPADQAVDDTLSDRQSHEAATQPRAATLVPSQGEESETRKRPHAEGDDESLQPGSRSRLSGDDAASVHASSERAAEAIADAQGGDAVAAAGEQDSEATSAAAAAAASFSAPAVSAAAQNEYPKPKELDHVSAAAAAAAAGLPAARYATA